MKNAIEYPPIAVLVLITIGLVYYLYKILIFDRKTVCQSVQQVDTHIVVDDQVIDEGDVYKIIEPVRSMVSIYDSIERYENDLEKYSIPQRYVFAITRQL